MRHHSNAVLACLNMLLIASSLPLFACGKFPKADKDDDSDAPEFTGRTILILDSGFDMGHPAYRDQIVAAYRLKCSDFDPYSITSVTEPGAKQSVIDMLQHDGDSCDIQSISPEILAANDDHFGEPITGKRDAWNTSVLAKTVPTNTDEFFEVQRHLTGIESAASYHGTMVASIIARNNPLAKLVLVNIDDLSSGISLVTDFGSLLAPTLTYWSKKTESDDGEVTLTCHTKQEFAATMAILEDPDVTAAAQTRLMPWKQQLFDLIKEHNVSLVNYSSAHAAERRVHGPMKESAKVYQERLTGQKVKDDVPGRIVTVPLDEKAAESHCEHWDYERLFTALNNMTAAQWRHYRDTGVFDPARVLIAQGAGNWRGALDSQGDSLMTPDHELGRILVGAHNAAFKPSWYSAQGQMISMYAFGDDVIAAAPSKFYTISYGTSLSAPMVLRYITQAMPNDLGVADIIGQLTAQLDANKVLPPAATPTELMFSSGEDSIFWDND